MSSCSKNNFVIWNFLHGIFLNNIFVHTLNKLLQANRQKFIDPCVIANSWIYFQNMVVLRNYPQCFAFSWCSQPKLNFHFLLPRFTDIVSIQSSRDFLICGLCGPYLLDWANSNILLLYDYLCNLTFSQLFLLISYIPIQISYVFVIKIYHCIEIKFFPL